MTIDQAVARLKNKARDLRDEGNFAAAHDYERDASDLQRLWDRAANTVPRTPAQRAALLRSQPIRARQL